MYVSLRDLRALMLSLHLTTFYFVLAPSICSHILVNLNGYTKGSRNEIFALRPAPIQMSFLGFCGTTGADWIDYLVTDKTCIPPSSNARKHYSESLLYMPHSYLINDHKQSSRDVLDPSNCKTREDYGLKEDKFVFFNFGQLYKTGPEVFGVWMNILKRVPNAVLWLLRFPALAEKNLMGEARSHGVAASRIKFSDVIPRDAHLRRGYLGDLYLDTPMCNSHATACDVLWSGTPMVTCSMEKMASRVG